MVSDPVPVPVELVLVPVLQEAVPVLLVPVPPNPFPVPPDAELWFPSFMVWNLRAPFPF